jgi:uncharacterized damage-inducible protein DinB
MNAAQLVDHWNVVWRDLMRGVAVLRDEHLPFQPAPGYPRTVGNLLNHIADLEEGWIHYVVRRSLPGWPSPGSGPRTSTAAIRSRLNDVHRATMDYLNTVPVGDLDRIVQVPGDGTPKLGWILWHVLEQEIHHRGELFLCLSLLGLERPEIDRPS